MSKGFAFFNQDRAYQPKNKKLLSMWLNEIAIQEGKSIEYVNYIFCSDEYLLSINLDFLKHDTYTDIITFEYNSKKEPITSDIFISIDRCKENAKQFNVSLTNEVHRLLAHGMLHLAGYQDNNKKNKTLMSRREDYYLSLRPEKLL